MKTAYIATKPIMPSNGIYNKKQLTEEQFVALLNHDINSIYVSVKNIVDECIYTREIQILLGREKEIWYCHPDCEKLNDGDRIYLYQYDIKKQILPNPQYSIIEFSKR